MKLLTDLSYLGADNGAVGSSVLQPLSEWDLKHDPSGAAAVHVF